MPPSADSLLGWMAQASQAAIVVAVAVVVALVLHLALFALLGRVTRLSQLKTDGVVLDRLRQPLRWSFIAIAISLVAETHPAIAGLARCYVTTGALDQAKQTLALVPESKRNDAAVKTVQTMIDLAEQASSLGPVAELEQKVAANPLDHQARFDLATALNAANRRSEATNHLLEIVKRDRKWNDDGARKQLVQFFEAWGGADEATVDGRRRLSTILFA